MSLILLWWLNVLGESYPSMIPLPKVIYLLRSYFISFCTTYYISGLAKNMVDFFFSKDFISLEVSWPFSLFLLVFQLPKSSSSVAAKKFSSLAVPNPDIPSESLMASYVHWRSDFTVFYVFVSESSFIFN